MQLTRVLALLAFAVAGAGSPGPNNMLLLTSGVRFGFKRTVPHIAGTTIGIGTLIVAVAAGIGVAVITVPITQTILKVAGSGYLLYLAYGLARSSEISSAKLAAPLTLPRAIAFQFVNPKGWIFAIAIVGAFLPPSLEPAIGGLEIASLVGAVVVATAVVWALGGAALNRLLRDDRSRRGVTAALAALMVGSVVLLWI